MEHIFAIFSDHVLPPIFTALVAWAIALLKKASKDRRDAAESMTEAMRSNGDAIRALLYDKLKYLCEKHISEGYTTVEDLKNLEVLYGSYKDLDGNGFIAALYRRASALPIGKE